MRRWLGIGLGLAAMAGVGLWVWRPVARVPAAGTPAVVAASEAKDDARSVPVVPVVTTVVRRKDVPVYLDGLGTVQAYNTVTVHTRIDGELIRVAFGEGQDVKAGDLLARIDARTYQAALDQAAATKARDEAQLELARLDLQRYLGLGNRVNGQTTDTQRALVKQLEATVKFDQATIDTARTMLDYTTITTPIDGRTGLRLVDVGNIVHAADQGGLVVVTQMQPIAVVFTLPQQNLPAINAQLRSQGKLPVRLTDADNKADLDRCELSLVDNQIDQTTGTIRLKAICPNSQRQLWPGQFINVRLLLSTRHDGLVVPAAAIQRGPQGAYVFQVGPDRTVEMRAVTVAFSENDESLIDAGLEAGDIVVTDGMARLQAGSKVRTGSSP